MANLPQPLQWLSTFVSSSLISYFCTTQKPNRIFIYNSAFCPFMSAFKETAFLLAVSSAALTHALAKACSSGRMERCTCDESPGIQHREAWQWGVCGDNLKYSTKFLKKFLGQKKVSKDLRAQVDAQNINVGIRVSAIKTETGSKCPALRPDLCLSKRPPYVNCKSLQWYLLQHGRMQLCNTKHLESQTNAPPFSSLLSPARVRGGRG